MLSSENDSGSILIVLCLIHLLEAQLLLCIQLNAEQFVVIYKLTAAAGLPYQVKLKHALKRTKKWDMGRSCFDLRVY